MSSEEKKGFALGKQNFLFMAIAFALIVIGFMLMTGGGTDQKFNPDIFSTRRITVGPMISLFGFFAMIFAIMWKPKSKK
jgi:hypothetical protein